MNMKEIKGYDMHGVLRFEDGTACDPESSIRELCQKVAKLQNNDRITERQAAVLSAFTGVLLGPFDIMHKYVEEIMDRPVFTHEMPSLADEIEARSKEEALSMCYEPPIDRAGS